MREKVKYVIKGKPTPLARPRYSKNKVYNSQKELMELITAALKIQHGTRALYQGPLSLNVTFYFPYPQKQSRVPRTWHSFRPDLSNLIKLIEDCAQPVLFHDDCAIAQIIANKLYDNEPRTEFIITELE